MIEYDQTIAKYMLWENADMPRKQKLSGSMVIQLFAFSFLCIESWETILLYSEDWLVAEVPHGWFLISNKVKPGSRSMLFCSLGMIDNKAFFL